MENRKPLINFSVAASATWLVFSFPVAEVALATTSPVPQQTAPTVKRSLIFNFVSSDIQRFRLTNELGTTDITMASDKSNYYFPGAVKAENIVVDGFLSGVSQTEFKETQTKAGLSREMRLKMGGKPRVSLHMQFRDKRPALTFKIFEVHGESTVDYFATVSDRAEVLSLTPSNIGRFIVRPESFRTNYLLTGREATATKRIRLTISGKEHLDFNRLSEKEWKVSLAKTSSRFEPSTPNATLLQITGLRITDYLGRSPKIPQMLELSSWSLSGSNGQTLRSFTLYQSQSTGDYFIKLASGETVLMDKSSVSPLVSSVTNYRKLF